MRAAINGCAHLDLFVKVRSNLSFGKTAFKVSLVALSVAQSFILLAQNATGDEDFGEVVITGTSIHR